MALMCCDSCSDVEFNPISLDLTSVRFCNACKRLVTHTSIAQNCYVNTKQTVSKALGVQNEIESLFETLCKFDGTKLDLK